MVQDEVVFGSYSSHSVSVFKCRFYYYSGMVRLTDQETTAVEKTDGYAQLQEAGRTMQSRAI